MYVLEALFLRTMDNERDISRQSFGTPPSSPPPSLPPAGFQGEGTPLPHCLAHRCARSVFSFSRPGPSPAIIFFKNHAQRQSAVTNNRNHYRPDPDYKATSVEPPEPPEPRIAMTGLISSACASNHTPCPRSQHPCGVFGANGLLPTSRALLIFATPAPELERLTRSP